MTEQAAWAEVSVAMRRLDRVPLRRLTKQLLVDAASSEAVSAASGREVDPDPIAGWISLGKSMTAGDPSDAWEERAAESVDRLLGAVPEASSQRDSLRAAVLSFCFLECLVAWEYTSSVEPLVCTLRVVSARAEDCAAEVGASDPRSMRVLDTVSAASRALIAEFAAEQAWLSSCPALVSLSASRAVAEIETACVALDPGGVGSGPSADPGRGTPGEGTLAGLELVLGEVLNDALVYFRLLSSEIGPAAEAFEKNLYERRKDEEVAAQVHRAAAAVAAAVGPTQHQRRVSREVPPGQIAGVHRTEARAHGRSLAAMLNALGGGEGERRPTLVVDQAEIHFLYPFGLPTAARSDDIDEARERLVGQFRSSGPPQLVGRSVTVDEALRTDVLSQAAGLFDHGAATSVERLVFSNDRLVLETSSGTRYEGLEIEVLLNGLGNHLVRIAVSTDTSVTTCSLGARHFDLDDAEPNRTCPGEHAPVSVRWTPHHLDSFLHRCGPDFGEERVYFRSVVDTAAGGHSGEPTKVWAGLLYLVADIVDDLCSGVGETGVEETTAAQKGAPDIDRAAQLRRQAHVLAVVSDASAVLDGECEPLRRAEDLAQCLGASPVFSPQPPAPRALEEWICSPPPAPSDQLGGLVGSMDSRVICNGDSTLIFAPASPNWQLLEDRELVMFAVSLGSSYLIARDGLLQATEQVGRLAGIGDLSSQTRDDLNLAGAKVRAAEAALARWISFADDLQDHALGVAVMRPRRDRALLDHVTESSGVRDLQRALSSTRQAAADRLTDLREMVGEVTEAQRRRGQIAVERFLLVVAVLAFIDLFWFFFDIEREELSLGTWHLYFGAVVTFLLVGALVIFTKVYQRGSPGAQPEDDSG